MAISRIKASKSHLFLGNKSSRRKGIRREKRGDAGDDDGFSCCLALGGHLQTLQTQGSGSRTYGKIIILPV